MRQQICIILSAAVVVSLIYFLIFSFRVPQRKRLFVPPQKDLLICFRGSSDIFRGLAGHRTVFVVTPVRSDAEAFANLLRLKQTVQADQRLIWIIVEKYSKACRRIFDPPEFAVVLLDSDGNWLEAAFRWIVDSKLEGIVYAASGIQNSFSSGFFDEIRTTRKISSFPVAFTSSDAGFSSPLVDDEGLIVGFIPSNLPLSNFAFSSRFLRNKTAWKFARNRSDINLAALGLKLGEVEVVAKGATEVMVWAAESVQFNRIWIRPPQVTDTLPALFRTLSKLGVIKISSQAKRAASTCYAETCP